MLTELPNLIDPLRAAQKGYTWHGIVKISALSPLADILVDSETHRAEVWVECFQDDDRRCIIAGKVQMQANVNCQRCLQPLCMPLEGHFKLCVVSKPTEADMVPSDCDPWVLEEAGLSLWSLAEETLILALPDAPKHPENICQMSDYIIDSV